MCLRFWFASKATPVATCFTATCWSTKTTIGCGPTRWWAEDPMLRPSQQVAARKKIELFLRVRTAATPVGVYVVSGHSANVLRPEEPEFERAITDIIVAQVGFARVGRRLRIRLKSFDERGQGLGAKVTLFIGFGKVVFLFPRSVHPGLVRSGEDLIIRKSRARCVDERNCEG